MSSPLSPRTADVGVVLPVHNEQALLAAALESLGVALSELQSATFTSGACVVLDSCTDRSEEITLSWRRDGARKRIVCEVQVLATNQRNVGAARAMGCAALLEGWKHVNPSRIRLATTDADSCVPRDWLSEQVRAHEEGVDLLVGPRHHCGAVVGTRGDRRAVAARLLGRGLADSRH